MGNKQAFKAILILVTASFSSLLMTLGNGSAIAQKIISTIGTESTGGLATESTESTEIYG